MIMIFPFYTQETLGLTTDTGEYVSIERKGPRREKKSLSLHYATLWRNQGLTNKGHLHISKATIFPIAKELNGL